MALVVGVVVTIVALLRLLVPTAIGLGDQGDAHRATCQLDVAMSSTWTERTTPDRSASAFVPFRWEDHRWYGETCGADGTGETYRTTEVTLLRGAELLTPLLGFDGALDLRALAVLSSVVLGVLSGVACLVLPGRPGVRAGIVALLVAVLLDQQVAGVFASGYSEPAALLGLFAVVLAALAVLRRREASATALLALAGAGAFTVLAKTQMVAVAPLVVAALVWRPSRARPAGGRGRLAGLRARSLGLLLAVGLLAVTGWYVQAQPARFTALNRHNQIFATLLTLDDQPEADLRWFGLDPKLARAAGTNITQDPEVTGSLAYEQVAGVSEADVARFYALHPGRLGLLLRRGLDAAASPDSTSYLGSYADTAHEAPYARENRLWLSSAFFEVADAVPAVLVLVVLTSLGASILLVRRTDDPAVEGPALVSAGVAIAAVLAFGAAVFGDGLVELGRHLLIADVLIAWALPLTVAAALGARKARPAPAVPPDVAAKRGLPVPAPDEVVVDEPVEAVRPPVLVPASVGASTLAWPPSAVERDDRAPSLVAAPPAGAEAGDGGTRVDGQGDGPTGPDDDRPVDFDALLRQFLDGDPDSDHRVPSSRVGILRRRRRARQRATSASAGPVPTPSATVVPPAPDPLPEPIPAPTLEPEPEPDPAPRPEPTPPAPVVAPEPSPVSTHEPEPMAVPGSTPDPEPVTEAATVRAPVPVSAATPTPTPTPAGTPDLEREPSPDPAPRTDPDPAPVPEQGREPEPEAAPVSTPPRRSGTDPRGRPGPGPRAGPGPGADPDAARRGRTGGRPRRRAAPAASATVGPTAGPRPGADAGAPRPTGAHVGAARAVPAGSRARAGARSPSGPRRRLAQRRRRRLPRRPAGPPPCAHRPPPSPRPRSTTMTTRSAEEISSQQFPMVRRGYDPVAVRAFLTELADDVGDPQLEAAAERAAAVEAAAEAAAAERLAQADREVGAAQARLAELEAKAAAAEASIADGEHERARLRGGGEQEAAALVADADSRAAALLADAEQQAEAIVADAKAEAEDVYRGRWQEAGGMVTRILEAAEAEASQLTENAEAVAVDIRNSLQAEVTRIRAEAERNAAEVRARAEEFADARLASAESEREQALESLAAAKAESERVEAEGVARAAFALRRAEDAVKAHVSEQLSAARQEMARLRGDEVEITARLSRVHELVATSLEVTASTPEPAVAQPEAFLLRLADQDEEADDDRDPDVDAVVEPDQRDDDRPSRSTAWPA
ncbi:DivIVA domain-containing protein [Aquihabitans sp. G128]|uniref:glycan biosynthesis hexose transferase WsfD n=1 Tax=Aquihabitans sp. G128 TaxID=2849779 RepID=UPI0020B389AD|nr:DivIVA domain-containing protein [Aquihabitans sp. G128]